MKPILVTGGAGYIGSHTVRALREAGRPVVVVDNLCAGHSASIPKDVPFENADTRDLDAMRRIIAKHQPSAVMHFAAFLAVGESVAKPLEYYDNNVVGVMRLLQAMHENGVHQFIFSSTCAIFGEPNKVPVDENTIVNPTSPYGQSKLAVEQLLPWVELAHKIQWTALRYFNAAGAHESGEIGLDTPNPTQLIPLALISLLKKTTVNVYGSDWPTPDGTCIRDYIHVMDLADAHIKALEKLEKGGKSTAYNLGTGKGTSVKEILDSVEKVTGQKVQVNMTNRRPGDPAAVYADSSKARTELGWTPQHMNIDDIIASAWKWHSTHPHGFEHGD